MQKVFEQLKQRLGMFINQRDDLALIVTCHEPESVIILKTLEGLDEESQSELFWIFPNAFDDAERYVSSVIEDFSARHEAVRLSMEQEGLPPWPELPGLLHNRALPPAQRLRSLMTCARDRLPVLNGALSVWVMFPAHIENELAYAQLMTEALAHEYPFPWCHHMRFIVRDAAETPAIKTMLADAPRIDWHEPDLSAHAMEQALEDEMADSELPVERRVGATMTLAGMDYAHQRYPEALEKNHLILPYFARLEDATMTAQTLTSIGECHEGMGYEQQAEAYYEHALEVALAQDRPPAPVLFRITLDLANLHFRQQRWATAEVYYASVEDLAVAQLTPQIQAHALENRGFCQHRSGKINDALRSWHKGAALALKIEDHALYKRLLLRLRDCYGETGALAQQQAVAQPLAELEEIAVASQADTPVCAAIPGD